MQQLAEIDGSRCLKCRAGYMTEVEDDEKVIRYICTGCECELIIKQPRRLST